MNMHSKITAGHARLIDPARARWDVALRHLQSCVNAVELAFDARSELETVFFDGKEDDPIPTNWAWRGIPGEREDMQRQRAEWRARCEEWRDQCGLAAAEQAHELAVDEMGDARTAFLETPAPDWAAVIVKIETAREHDLGLENLDGVIADLRCLGANA